MLGNNQRSSRPQMGHVQETSVGFKLAVCTICGDSGAGGLVAPPPCTAYFGKLAKLLIWLFLATASVGLVYLYTYHSLA